ncbi:MAG: metal ABC transporter permease [Geminocystis sp.]|nr:metal ABC transporter permease [Geminocystis sp.]HIK36465.1 metal ABC transporter permease [Geminocystis sp. M7585_C2015_104]MCS7147597.1 metal ABC transporter permease [Geminocystis sp.]MCX8078000.1 metal ABC transporter permease [Geminocystis sp.]MDW8115290.1 metal ABC transporter permease [Geminocystis sp.]
MIWNLLLEPLQYGFMQRALVVAVVVGIICAIVGSYLMVQRLALLGDAISHSLLPGVALAYIFNSSIFLGALIAGLLSTVLINGIKNSSKIKEDAAMGLVFSSFFALGIILITLVQKENKIDLNHFLFGNILGVSAEDLKNTILVGVIVVLTVVLLYKELLFYTFDRLGAEAVGLPVIWLDTGLMVLVGLTIVASLKAVGVILVLSLLITPPATAYLLVNRLHQVMYIGMIVGIISSITGMYLSYYFNLPSGPSIVLVAAGFFTLSFLFSPSQGLVSGYLKLKLKRNF